jgi:hypothetical protein
MQTPMVREGGTFAVDLQVPLGSTIRYGFLITETYTGQGIEVWETGTRGEYLVIASRDLSVGTQTKLSLAPVDLRIQYRIEGAGQVFLAWGINGWNALPDEQLPAGTVLEKGTMRTPMTREGNLFAATVQVAPYTKVNYGFVIAKTTDGSSAGIWERERDFRTTVSERGGIVLVDSSLSLEGDLAQATFGDGPPAILEIRYHAPGADEVLLVWGVNGWFPIAEEARPAGTFVEEGVMRTPMVRSGDRFVSSLEIPVGTRVEFGFLAITTEDSGLQRTWDGSDDYRLVIAQQDLVVDVNAQVTQELILDATDVPEASLVTQEIRYHQPEAQQVFLVWDVEGGNLEPGGWRPAGTEVRDDGLYTPMDLEGNTFVARVEVPGGAIVKYRFLTTKSSSGTAVEIWDTGVGASYQLAAAGDETIEIEAAPAPLQEPRDTDTTRIGIYLLLLGATLLAGVAAVLLVRWAQTRSGH